MSKHKESKLVSNRRAFYDYEIIETFEAGIILSGTEVKSLRNHEGSLQEAYILISQQGKVLLKNASIAPYRFGNIFNHEDKRDRFLLLHKKEIIRLKNLSQEKGFALIPLSMYLKNGFIKVEGACARGKKNYDKRQALKEKEHKKTIQQAMRNRID
ncbi:MAG TPA: SsrA-binding protein SmpB [Candidatus Rhabdochlamydia sp.]|jgi:SsrA-binding protein|nr:SsrA-binding protein SmpB [Candidatus Rhabdochlamydia sp.]